MFEKMPKFTKEMIVRGIYSLFELKQPLDGFKIVLITSNDDAFLMNENGDKGPRVDTKKISLGKIITINDSEIVIPDSVKIYNGKL